uniref:B-cell receptor CD22 n=1 Tax=Amphiprion percula TaxID=161767 RepID=A0A3P8TQF6_AMPPE
VVYLIVVSDVLCVTVAHSQNWDVTYTQLRMCGPRGSAVDMNCSYTYPAEVHGKENIVQTKFWYVGRKEDLQRKSSSYEGRVHYDWHYDSDCTLRITDLRVEDSAVYKFRFITNLDKFSGEPGVTLTVTDAPKLPSVSVSASAEIVEGSSVNLTCNGEANPAATYTWFKVNDRDPLSQTPHIYNLASISSEDKGNYCCKSENKHGQSSSFLFISVQYAPKLPSVSGSVSGEGSSVTVTCSSDANPAANYTWYKENEDSPKASGQTFTISDDGHEQSGNYQCKVQNSRGHHSSTLHLVVMASTTPASTSLRTRHILSIPTPCQLSPKDTWRTMRKTESSTLLSILTVAVVLQGEQLFTLKHYPQWKTNQWFVQVDVHAYFCLKSYSLCKLINSW